MPKTDISKTLIQQAVLQLNSVCECLSALSGSSHLRKMLFQIMDCYIKTAPLDEPIYQFLDRKRIEGKHYYCYMTAGSAKFLRIYYAKVSQILNSSV